MGLVLKIDNGQTAITVTKKLFISSVTKRTQVTGDATKNCITFVDNRQTYEEWYNDQIHAKKTAMVLGEAARQGSAVQADNEQPGFTYNFVYGTKTYTHNRTNPVPYLKTLQGNAPGSTGNFQILPGKTVDVSTVDNSILFTKLDTGISVDPGLVYREINVLLWYLYHALNVQIYRLHTFDPTQTGTGAAQNSAPVFAKSHWMGTIPEYQALVARWNWLVWKRSFLIRCEEAGETLNFSMGFSGTSCGPVTVNMTFTLTLQGSEHAYEDTIRFFTVYLQGVNTNVQDAAKPNILIKKIGSASSDSSGSSGEGGITVDGHGSDQMCENGQTWNKAVVSINNLQVSQGEHYNAAFSIALALNEQTAYFYQQIGNDSFLFDGLMEWQIGEETYKKEFNNQHLRTILLHSEEDTGESSISYNGGR